MNYNKLLILHNFIYRLKGKKTNCIKANVLMIEIENIRYICLEFTTSCSLNYNFNIYSYHSFIQGNEKYAKCKIKK
jgi:hypothetical protein